MKSYLSISDFLQKESTFSKADIEWFQREGVFLSNEESDKYLVVRTKLGTGFDSSWFDPKIFDQIINLNNICYIVSFVSDIIYSTHSTMVLYPV